MKGGVFLDLPRSLSRHIKIQTFSCLGHSTSLHWFVYLQPQKRAVLIYGLLYVYTGYHAEE